MSNEFFPHYMAILEGIPSHRPIPSLKATIAEVWCLIICNIDKAV